MNTAGMGIGMWLFWIVTALIVVFIIKLFMDGTTGNTLTKHGDPIDILKKRYAKGEIDETEYGRRKKELGE